MKRKLLKLLMASVLITSLLVSGTHVLAQPTPGPDGTTSWIINPTGATVAARAQRIQAGANNIGVIARLHDASGAIRQQASNRGNTMVTATTNPMNIGLSARWTASHANN